MSSAKPQESAFEASPVARPSVQLSQAYIKKVCEPDASVAFRVDEVDVSARECRRVGSPQFFAALAALLVSRAAKAEGGGVLSIKSLTSAKATEIASQDDLMAAVSELLDVDRATVLETAGDSSCHIVLGNNPIQDSIGGETTVIYGTEGLVVATMEQDGSIMFMGAIDEVNGGRNKRELDYRNAVHFQISSKGIKVFVPISKLLSSDAIAESPNLKPGERLVLEMDFLWGVYPGKDNESEDLVAFPKSMSIKRYPLSESISIIEKGKRFEALLRGVSPHHLGVGVGAEPIRGTKKRFAIENSTEDGTFIHEFDIFRLLDLDPDTFMQTPAAIAALRLLRLAGHAVGVMTKRKVRQVHNIPVVDRYMVTNVRPCVLSEIIEGTIDFNSSMQDALMYDHEDDGFQLSADSAKGIVALIRAITPEIWFQNVSASESDTK